MIPQSDKRNEPTKRTLLAGGLLLVLVNLGATPGSLRPMYVSPAVPGAAQRAALQHIFRSEPPAGLLTGGRSASTDPATALQVVPAPEPRPYLSVGSTPAAWSPGAGESPIGAPGSAGQVSAGAGQPPLSPADRIRSQRPAEYLMARSGRPLAVVGITTVIGWAREASNAPPSAAPGCSCATSSPGTSRRRRWRTRQASSPSRGSKVGPTWSSSSTPADDVLAVGQVFNVAPGETAATFLKLAEKPSFMTGFFNNTAASVLSSAAGAGMIGVVPTGDPISPE